MPKIMFKDIFFLFSYKKSLMINVRKTGKISFEKRLERYSCVPNKRAGWKMGQN